MNNQLSEFITWLRKKPIRQAAAPQLDDETRQQIKDLGQTVAIQEEHLAFNAHNYDWFQEQLKHYKHIIAHQQEQIESLKAILEKSEL